MAGKCFAHSTPTKLINTRQGLVPFGDYVLAWSGGPLHSENDFYRLIEAHVDRPLRLFVHNSDLDNLREVILYPTRQWGGEGLIGCGIG